MTRNDRSRIALLPMLIASVLIVGASAQLKPTSSIEHRHSERGRASWYGKQLHGRRTANGETFDMHALTAAHRSLPFGTIVRVTAFKSGKSVYVRINDRGPFRRERIIDLSYGAARQLGIVKRGVARVEITVIARA